MLIGREIVTNTIGLVNFKTSIPMNNNALGEKLSVEHFDDSCINGRSIDNRRQN